ncbi:hypothetical protein [Aeromonas salmonicida]|uniref:hypothetical protein n=1 Tax=Aeromonas salmonicida TaxID=645 RepID=UPI001865068B|nr:hypothetical protein [Aeromonas salmonicida]
MNDHRLLLLSPWVERLSVTTRSGGNVVLQMDFNRLRYLDVPRSKAILSGLVTSANRDDVVLRLFNAITGRKDAAQATKFAIFTLARQYVAFCDQHGFTPLTQEGVAGYLRHLHDRQRRGEIKDSVETSMRVTLSTLLQWLELPFKHWLAAIPISGSTQSEPARGYSDGDLKQMLPLLRGLFKQLHQQFIAEPERHIHVPSSATTMRFDWKGQQYSVRTGVTKLFCVATYLLSYYSWANSSVLYRLKRPQIVSHTPSDDWYKMRAFKRRAFKTITVEIGTHDRLEIPSYALQFFDQLLNASRLVNPHPDGWLLLVTTSGPVIMMNSTTLAGFKRWLARHFPMTDDRGERLWPVVGRFRATGGQLSLATYGLLATAQLLDNTPNIVSQAYSSGNPHENDQMIRDSSHTLEHAVRDRQGIAAAKQKTREEQNVEVLAYEEYVRRASPLSRSANGSYCKDKNSDKAQRFTTRARQRGLLPEGERLACADLLGCWTCEHQVLVEAVNDVWCAISFREFLEESKYMHLNNKHHQQNFGEVIANINTRLKLINHQVLRKAERKMVNEGRHPLWPDVASVNAFSEGKSGTSAETAK